MTNKTHLKKLFILLIFIRLVAKTHQIQITKYSTHMQMSSKFSQLARDFPINLVNTHESWDIWSQIKMVFLLKTTIVNQKLPL